MRFYDADRLARLHDERFAIAHRLERRYDLVVRGPVACGAAERGVNDQVVWILTHCEHVF